MVNTAGTNGTDNGERPSDDVLKESLMRYARLQLKVPARLANLASEHNYRIGKTKLNNLNKEFNIPTTRKPPPLPVVTTLVCAKLENDLAQGNGPEAMKTFLALDGYQVPRDTIREVMKDNAPGAAKRRYPGTKDKVTRKNLTAQGVFQELHCDGHEKLGSAALRMGPVGIAIYGFRDKGSGTDCGLRAVPDARHAVVIGHLYLYLVLEFGAFPMQITVDKGSETGEMYAAQVALRETVTPDIDPLKFPPVVALKSTNNIPIENLWKWLRKTCGRSLREWIEDGKTNGIFNPGSMIHVHLFHWLWSQIVQIALDQFTDYWNYHKSHNNPHKDLPSGVPPLEIFRNPQAYRLAWLGTPVEADVVDALRENLTCSREEAFQWVPEEFDTAANQVYADLRCPKLEPSRGWTIFGQMAPQLENVFDI
ncbi:hypothetical protein DFH07DRAFT_1015377 [Mycena maculata]|uniref:Uncharacterized protein n=1 Tax=Mycena maculata TaxID=230809 RepID=A0AAD7H8R6_9AGAR|nr:hypothetical protein DFH07DRAFT_1015377 [Mycena maculata]